jgi:hypothetical protein
MSPFNQEKYMPPFISAISPVINEPSSEAK